MTDANFENWKARAKAVPIARVIDTHALGLKRVGAELIGPCPKCGGTDRFSINPGKGVFNCRGCNAAGDGIALTMFVEDCTFAEACEKLTGEPPPKPNGKANGKDHDPPEKKTDFYYHNAAGDFVFGVRRIEHGPVKANGKRAKKFPQWRPDPDNVGKQIWNVDGCPLLIYKLPEVLEAIANEQPIFIVEGEACANLLWSWKVAATCNSCGAGKWKSEHSAFLKDADVVLLPDNDDDGWQHVNDVAASLKGIAKSIKVLVLSHDRPKYDIVDWARRGGTREQFDTLVAAAQDWKFKEGAAPPDDEEKKKAAEASEAELIARLAEMPEGLNRARERRRLASQLRVSRSDIDDQVRAYQEDKSVAPLYGHWIVEPWPDPVDGDGLLRDIIRRIKQHVVIEDHNVLAIALWLVMAWVHEAIATHSPILRIASPEPECGKTTLMHLIAFLMPRCIATVEASEAAIFRAIDRWSPSFCFDEFDDVLKDDNKAALRSIINSGHVKGDTVLRCVGDDKVPKVFPTFAPKAIAMNGNKLPPATMSRCITIEQRRRKKAEGITKFKHQDDAGLAELRSRLRRWAMDNEEALKDPTPLVPPEMWNRGEDNWLLQWAIADLCDGVEGYGDKARAAAVKIIGKIDRQTSGEKALAAIKAIFVSEESKWKGAEAIWSEDLIAAMTADPDSDWHEWRSGKPITQPQLARLLKRYAIRPEQVRIGTIQKRGYVRARFQDAWEAYT